MYSSDMIVEPASLWAVHQICNNVEGFWVFDFGIDDVGDCIVAEVDLDFISRDSITVKAKEKSRNVPCHHRS